MLPHSVEKGIGEKTLAEEHSLRISVPSAPSPRSPGRCQCWSPRAVGPRPCSAETTPRGRGARGRSRSPAGSVEHPVAPENIWGGACALKFQPGWHFYSSLEQEIFIGPQERAPPVPGTTSGLWNTQGNRRERRVVPVSRSHACPLSSPAGPARSSVSS